MKQDLFNNSSISEDKNKVEHIIIQNESMANATNSLIDMNEYMVTQQENIINKDVILMNYSTLLTRRFICYELENDFLVVVDKCSENNNFFTLKIVNIS